jgi:DNA-directed RNA polymerase specialized sigma subunit
MRKKGSNFKPARSRSGLARYAPPSKKVGAVSRELTAKNGRTPTEAEIASELGITTARWRRMARERSPGLVSTTPREDLDRAAEREFPADSNGPPDRICEQRQLRFTFDRAMGKLPNVISA